jgi:D-inositol-3-phosphate glycosyltransferase
VRSSLHKLGAALYWRLQATRRLWRSGVTPDMPFLPPKSLTGGLSRRLAALMWRLRATRRLWSVGVTPDMPLLPPESLTGRARGKIDEPRPGAKPYRETLYVRGWTLFPSGPPARLELWLGELSLGAARVGLRRPDIEARTGDPLAGVTGFELTADLSELDLDEGATMLRAVATSTTRERHELPPVPVEVPADAGAGDGEEDSLPPPAARTPRRAGSGGRQILVCTHQLNLGGAQLYLMDLLRELVAGGSIEPTVVSALDGILREELEELGIPVHISSLVPLDDLSSHIGRVEELTAWMDGRDFEAVLVNTATAFAFPGAEAAAELGIPAVWAIHESFPPTVLWSNLHPEIKARAESALGQAALAIFEADATRRLFEPPLREGRGVVLPYGLDFDPIDAARAGFDRTAARREAGVPEDAEVILCVGTVEPRKAQLPLAQAFGSIAAAHPRARLVFVGARDDQDSEALADFVSASGLGDRVELVPVTPDVHPWYQLADLLVCASDIESLPRTVLEAMAFETPVLATSVFGLPELIDDGETGWLCEPRDMPALAAALDRALNSSPEERRRIGRASRELVLQRHDLPAYGRRVAELLDGVAAGESPKVADAAPN